MLANREVIMSYVSRFNAGDLEGLRELFTPDAEVQGVLGWGKVADVMPIWQQLVAGLNMQLEVLDLISEGSKVAVRYRETGVSVAPFFEKPATGRSYELLAMEWFELKEGKIYRRWGARDATSQARQLGWEPILN